MSTWKNLCKRGFAVFLSLTLCLSLMNVSAFAAGAEDVGSDDTSISDTQNESETSTESNEDKEDADEPAEDGNDAENSDESDEDENGETQTPEDEEDTNKPAEGENGETQTPEGEGDASEPTEGENGETQAPEGEEDANKPVEGENGETQAPEGEEDANKPAEGENGETQTPDEGENGETQTPDEEETSGALGEFLSKIEAIGSGELDMDGILSAIDDCLSSYEQLSEEEKAALADARDALLTYQGELTGVLPDPIAPQLPELPEVPQAPQYSDAVQAFLDAAAQLPEEVTEENVEEVGAALEALLPLYQSLSEEEQNLDVVVSAYIRVMAVYEQYTGVKAMLMDGFVARAGEEDDEDVEYFETLQLAIRSAEGRNVYLLQDVTESVLLPANGAVLDLGGHTLTGNGRAAVSIMALRIGDLTIQNGTIVGAEGYRAIVASNVNLTLDRVTMNPSGSLESEKVDYSVSYFGGGCVYIDSGTLTVENCIFSGDAGKWMKYNGSQGGIYKPETPYGSHIFAASGVSSVAISGSTFENSASEYGAVYAACANVTVADSTFTNNGNGLQLDNKNGLFDVSGTTFTGGTKAINASSGSKMTLNITDSTFSGFTGGPVVNANGATNITGGSFSSNSVDSNGVVQLGGGALEMDGTSLTDNTSGGVVKTYSAADVTMRNVTATGNKGTSSMNSGGSVLNANSIKGKTVILENVTAKGNEQTKEHGGAFYFGGNSKTVIEIKNCTLTGNTAKNSGGAIYLNNKGTTTITDTEIRGNTANGTGKVAGGGIYVGSTSGTVTLAGSTRIYSNETPKASVKHLTVGAAADIALVSNYSKGSDFTSEDAVQRATLVQNNETSFTGDDGNKYILTKSDAKGLHYSSGSGSSKKFYWPAGYYTVVEEPARVFVNAPAGSHTGENNFVADDLANAVALARESGAQTIYVCGNVTVDMASAVSLNSGITFTRCTEHRSGHMFTINGEVTLDNAHIDGNKVDGDASMIYVSSSGHLTIAGNTLIENGKNAAAKGKGGAIYVHQGSLTMTGGTISNSSAREGGGIYAFGGTLVAFEGGKVSNNTATGGNGGGGAYIEATSSEFGVNGGRTYFEGNIANQMGGGVFLVNGTNANTHHFIYKATFTGNRSLRTGYYYDGGAIYIQSGTTAHMKNVYVSGNTDSDPWLAHNNYTAVAVCPTGELAVYELEGLLAVNNNGKVDIGVVAGGVMPSVDPMVYLPSYAPGGGSVSYTYSNGNPVELDEHQFTKGYFRVKTIASDSAIASARATAEADGVVITGNYATQFGAGIMTNGILKIGTETTTLRVNKVWDDGNKNHANDRIVVYLTQDGKIVDQDFRDDSCVILCEENNWSYTWTNLGDQFTWGVQEAAVPGYSSEVKVEKDTEFGAIADKYYVATITNAPSPEESERLVISKTAYGLDPDASYKFTLKLDNVGDKVFSIQLPDGSVAPIYNNEITFYLKDGQSAVVEGLPVGYTYEVTEEENPAYKSFTFDSVTEDVNGSITSVMVVNLPLVSITVQKLWNDTDDAAFRPDSITVNLMNGEMVMDTAVVTPDENGNWFHTFADLPEYDAEGNKIAYTVKEVGADGYDAKYELNTDGVWVITNTLRRGSLTINKAVVGGGGEAADKEFTFTVTGADENTKDYKETVTIKGAGTGVLQGLLPGAYTVTEADASISGYTWNVSGTGDVTVEANKEAEDTTNVNVTNTYTENKPLDGSLTITKVIRGGGSEAQNKTYTFTVTGPDGYNRTVTITGEGSVTLSPLTPGVYTVTEDRAGAVISGYTLTISGSGSTAEVVAGGSADVTITNTYTTPGDPGDPEDPEDPEDPPTPPPTPEIPDEEVPLTDIPEEEVPLAEIPEEPEELEIPEEEVPLADVPETGDLSGNWMMAMLMGALGMIWMALTGKKRSEEEG